MPKYQINWGNTCKTSSDCEKTIKPTSLMLSSQSELVFKSISYIILGPCFIGVLLFDITGCICTCNVNITMSV